jgi:methylglyoxal synthase
MSPAAGPSYVPVAGKTCSLFGRGAFGVLGIACIPELVHRNTQKGRIRMIHKKIAMEHDKKIALVAHDNKKRDLVEWAKFNRELLAHHKIYATGTTGELLEQELGFRITKLQSGPLGGDQQIGAKIADSEIDFLIFFWDPLEPQPHDPDVKALLRMAVVWNIPIACNRASADFMISSPLMDGDYDRLVPDYDTYRNRKLAGDDPDERLKK